MDTERKRSGEQNIPTNDLGEIPTQDQTSLGGEYNSGVTSRDPSEKEEIEKKGSLAQIDQSKPTSEKEE